MLLDWWKAHRLEVYIDLGAIALMLVVVMPLVILHLWWKDKKRKR